MLGDGPQCGRKVELSVSREERGEDLEGQPHVDFGAARARLGRVRDQIVALLGDAHSLVFTLYGDEGGIFEVAGLFPELAQLFELDAYVVELGFDLRVDLVGDDPKRRFDEGEGRVDVNLNRV